MRRRAILILALVALAALAVPVAASARKSRRPVITRVTPMRLHVGQRVTVRGRNFSSRRRRNTVIFRDSDGRSAFAKPRSASRRKLVLNVPAAVARLVRGKRTVRFTLRIITRGKTSRWTRKRLSPVVLGSAGQGGGGGGSACPGTDFDHDFLPADLEAKLGTDPCLADTDGDGVDDGFEYRSAIDLNNDNYENPNESLPYPGKRPYPNPLDPSDGNTDYDGDSLSQAVEQRLWKYSTNEATRSLSPCDAGVATPSCLTYSDGLQYSIYKFQAGQGDRHFPAITAPGYSKAADFQNWASAHGYRNVYIDGHGEYGLGAASYGVFDTNLTGVETAGELRYYDLDGNGVVSDDERDEDADGLTNFDENSGRMNFGWWASCYKGEAPYYVHYAGTDPADPDSDGDGVRDGADDQDHDDVPNVDELSRNMASGLWDAKDSCSPQDNLPSPLYHADAY